MLKEFYKDKLKVYIAKTRLEMGKKAAKDIKAEMLLRLSEKENLNMIFAAAPSQNEVLSFLREDLEIPWNRINAFHMDEYVGLAKDSPKRFAQFLSDNLFDKVAFREVFYINADADPEIECKRYSDLLKEYPTDIVCLGIGENGHIAFNDPWVADFNDKDFVKKVPLDDVCRQQQVNDGCFENIDLVPKFALTLTVPALFAGKAMFCTVPASTKAWAVEQTVTADISEEIPATILRRHSNAFLYCDAESGKLIL